VSPAALSGLSEAQARALTPRQVAALAKARLAA